MKQAFIGVDPEAKEAVALITSDTAEGERA